MKRLSLYVFYERNGCLRDSERYYLQGHRAVADQAVIVNGPLSAGDLEVR